MLCPSLRFPLLKMAFKTYMEILPLTFNTKTAQAMLHQALQNAAKVIWSQPQKFLPVEANSTDLDL